MDNFSRRTKILILIATLMPLLHMAAVVTVILVYAPAHQTPNVSPAVLRLFTILFTINALTALWFWALLAFYIVHLFRTTRIPQPNKALWAAILFLGSIFAMLVYWYLYIWRQPREAAQ